MQKPLEQSTSLQYSKGVITLFYKARLIRTAILSLLFLVFAAQVLKAQLAVTEMARYMGGNDYDGGGGSKTVNGFTYVWYNTRSNNLPVTNGSTFRTISPNTNVYVAKLNSAGSIVFASYMGGTTSDAFIYGYTDLEVAGNDIYFVFSTSSTNLPVTNGTTLAANGNNAVVRMNTTTGAVVFCTYYGGSGSSAINLKVNNGDVYLEGITTAINLPVTNGSVRNGAQDLFFARFNGNTGNITWSTYWGSDGVESYGISSNMEIIGGEIYFATCSNGTTASLPSTDGTVNSGGYDVVYARLNRASGATSFLTYLGGTADEKAFTLRIANGETYILGNTVSANFPSTNGSFFNGSTDVIVIKYNAAGSRVYSTFIGGSSTDGTAVIPGRNLDVSNGYAYIAATTNSPNYPVTNGTSLAGGNDFAVTKLNASGNIVFSTLIGSTGNESIYDVKVQCDNDVYVFGLSRNANYPITNGTLGGISLGILVVSKFDVSTGRLVFSSGFNPGAGIYNANSFELSGTGIFQVYVGGNLINAVTIPGNGPYGGTSDVALVRMNTCPTGYTGSPAVTPSTQSICVNGVTTSINMAPCIIPGSTMPLLYVSGVGTLQNDIPVRRYQWQVADAPGGPWTDISGGITQSYTPPTGAVNKYYRRLSFSYCCGTETLEQTGDVAAVLAGSNTAPTVNGGGPFNTCSGTPVTIGGSPTATANGGATITSYVWTPAVIYTPDNTVSNPSVSPATSTIYSVLVTDNNGCQQIGQALVNVYAANAGPNKNTCGGQIVRIGTAPITGVPGVTYSWTASPADPAMSCTTCAQPDVHPAVTTTYTVTLTIPVSGGGTCSTTSSVVVSAVAAPTNNGGAFGGPDVTICSGGTAVLGTPAEAGFVYTWAPGNYLTANNIAQPIFQPGNSSLPNPDPFIYYVTAVKSGCNFVDSVSAFVIKADAGKDGCGPKNIGTTDITPGIGETYSWVKITAGAGTSDFLGATNLPVVPVSAGTVPTTFQLTVTVNGVSCTDDVIVAPCGCVNPSITVNGPHGCASYDLNAGTVSLTASSMIPSTFTWSPTTGLSSNTGATVFLTDNIARTYTVTATSIIDPSYSCTKTVDVNNAAWSLPVFTAQDVTVCPATGINIGQPTVAGYSYLWDQGNNPALNSTVISNPIATVSTTTNFSVLVTDNVSGCTITDTATVSIIPMPQNPAGNNITICGPATVQLGINPVPGITYLWTPAAGYIPDNMTANPTVPVAATTTYHVDATSVTAGCTVSGDITVTVGSPVSPFSFSDITFCPGGTELSLPAGPGGMSSYSWSPSSQVINPASNGPTATTLNPSPSVTTAYSLTVTNASGCTATAGVNFIPQATAPIAGSKMVCLNGGPVMLGSAGNPTGGGITYSWSPATNLSSSTSPNPLFTPAAVGVFNYTFTKNDGGCITSTAVVVTVQNFILPSITSPAICQNTCVQIGTTPQIGAIYSWYPATGLSNPNIANPISCPAANTTYTLTAIGVNGCVATQQSIITISPDLSPSVSVPAMFACLGSTGLSFNPTVGPSGTYNYEWLPNNGTLNNIYSQNPVVNITGVGTKAYNLKVTDQTTGCSSTGTGSLTVAYCTLPVKLESFTAAPKGSNVLLSWVVSEEINVSRYEAEFSMNGENFTGIGSVTASGSRNYNMLHTAPVKGINYYRIKMIDKDGQSAYSAVRKVNVSKQRGNLSIYPNPARDEINIVLPAPLINKSASIQVYSTNGKLMLKENIRSLSQTQVLNTSHLPAGVYAIVVLGAEGVYNSKVIISR